MSREARRFLDSICSYRLCLVSTRCLRDRCDCLSEWGRSETDSGYRESRGDIRMNGANDGTDSDRLSLQEGPPTEYCMTSFCLQLSKNSSATRSPE